MLHVSLRVPDDIADEVVGLLADEETVTNLAVTHDAFLKPEGALVVADVAREAADRVVAMLRALDLHHRGSIHVSEAGTILSDEVHRVERAAPGLPEDSLVWDLVENRVRLDSRLSFAFLAFLTLATLIAGIGRLLDQPILIIGAMVVGPEFSPVAAICVALSRPRLSLLPQALGTLAAGFATAVAIAAPLWWLAYHLGVFTQAQASSGRLTDFIIHPDWWSLVIAMLAGVAGTLSLTTAKSGPLVGVFISVTTVPAVGTIALCLGSGVWSEVSGAVVQLVVNIAGLVVAGTLTLLVQKLVWSRVDGRRRADAPAGPLP